MPSSTNTRNGQHETPHSALPPEGQDGAPTGTQPFDPIAPVLLQVLELMKALREYAMTWTDQARIALQIGIYKAAIAIVIGLAGMATLVVGASMLLIGAATGIGMLFGGRVWVGQILVGTSVFAITFTALAAWRSAQRKTNWKDLLRRYEHATAAEPHHHDHAESPTTVPE